MGLSINNVSMDYFLRGVDAAKPQGAQPGVPVPEGANEPVAQEPQMPASWLAAVRNSKSPAVMASIQTIGAQAQAALFR